MSIPSRLTANFRYCGYYHIVCKSLRNQRLFLSDENKRYFLQRYSFYLFPYVSTYAYCLLDNHVHFVVKIKDEEEIIAEIVSTEKECTRSQLRFLENPTGENLGKLLDRQFNSFFVSYTRSYNNYYHTKGHLFDSPFKKVQLQDETHTTQAIIYVHSNAVRHKLSTDIENYNWSSYNSILSNRNTLLCREHVLEWFGGVEGFIQAHKVQSRYYYQ
jgi:REP element-mobilizing transposase RayT